jgi:hypothetical protein
MANEPDWRVATYTGTNGDCVEVATWRVATYTGGQGNCVEVGAWRAATYTGGNGNCVEVADAARAILVRDTKDRPGGTLTFPATTWRAFTGTIK